MNNYRGSLDLVGPMIQNNANQRGIITDTIKNIASTTVKSINKKIEKQKNQSTYIPLTSDQYDKDKELRYKLGLGSATYQGFYRNFNRYYNIYPEIENDGIISYVFLTRPDLNIIRSDRKYLSKTCEKDPFLSYMWQFHHIVLENLTSGLESDHDFITLLSDRTLSMQLQDYSIKNYQLTQYSTGMKFQYAGNGVESTSGGTFDITFRDDYHFRITKFLQSWVYCIDKLQRGIFEPYRTYIYENSLDYASSAYEIVCNPTGRDIIYFAKYTGIFPLSVPHSNYSHNLRGEVDNEITSTFAYSDFRVLDPMILRDFNKNSRKHGPAVDSYNSSLMVGNYQSGSPYIYNPTEYQYQLLWNEPKEYDF